MIATAALIALGQQSVVAAAVVVAVVVAAVAAAVVAVVVAAVVAIVAVAVDLTPPLSLSTIKIKRSFVLKIWAVAISRCSAPHTIDTCV